MIVTCVQLTPRADAARRRDACLKAIVAARKEGAELIVLPELATSGYIFSSVDEARSLAVGLDDNTLAEWATALEDDRAVVVGGFCEAGPDGLLYNSAAVVDRSGVRTVYRKTHLWDAEKIYFSPGDDLPPVIDLPSGRVGILICYDLEFPEMPRGLALAGADLLAVPTSWPLVDRPAGERSPEVIIAMGAARVNRMAIACADRCGVERGQQWTGGTSIIDHFGWIAATSSQDGLVTADVEPADARDKRASGRNDLLADRRPDLYHRLLSPEQLTA